MTDGHCADDVTVLRLREAQHRHRNTLQILTSLARKRSRQSQNRQVRENLAYFAEIVEIFAHLDRQASDGHRAPIVSRLNAMSRRWHILGNGHVEVVLEVDDGLALPTSDETVVVLCAHECVLNAFKHAFPDGRRGRIHVQLSRPTDLTVRLSIEDDGVGMLSGRHRAKAGCTAVQEAWLLPREFPRSRSACRDGDVGQGQVGWDLRRRPVEHALRRQRHHEPEPPPLETRKARAAPRARTAPTKPRSISSPSRNRIPRPKMAMTTIGPEVAKGMELERRNAQQEDQDHDGRRLAARSCQPTASGAREASCRS